MLIGVISDTHGLLRQEALERLAGVEHIIHAGDIGKPEIVAALERIAPVSAIRGNVDTGAWAARYPYRRTVVLAGVTVHVLHDLAGLAGDAAAFDVVVCGHSHRPKVETTGGVLYLNPGSAGPRRFKLPVTLATLELAGDRMRPLIHKIVP